MRDAPDVPRLPYERLRPLIQSGDLLLCSGHATFSKMIQAATDSLWSHCALILRAASIDRLLVVESVESIGTRVGPLRHYVDNYNGTKKPYNGRLYIARHAGCTGLQADTIAHMAQVGFDLLGAPYDTTQIAAIALRITAAKLGLPTPPPVQDDLFICSEMVWRILHTMGIPLAYNSRGFIAPDDIATDPAVTILWEIATGGPACSP